MHRVPAGNRPDRASRGKYSQPSTVTAFPNGAPARRTRAKGNPDDQLQRRPDCAACDPTPQSLRPAAAQMRRLLHRQRQKLPVHRRVRERHLRAQVPGDVHHRRRLRAVWGRGQRSARVQQPPVRAVLADASSAAAARRATPSTAPARRPVACRATRNSATTTPTARDARAAPLHCDVPVNGGKGKCGITAPGCSDLGKGVAPCPSRSAASPTRAPTTTTAGASTPTSTSLRSCATSPASASSTTRASRYPMHACASVTFPIIKASCVSASRANKNATARTSTSPRWPRRVRSARQRGGAASCSTRSSFRTTTRSTCIGEPASTDTGVCAPVLEQSCALRRRASSGGARLRSRHLHAGRPPRHAMRDVPPPTCARTTSIAAKRPHGHGDAALQARGRRILHHQDLADPDTCQYKKAGCTAARLQAYSSYQCDDINRSAIGSQCLTNQYLPQEAPTRRNTAILAPPGDGGTQVPQCFNTP